MTKWDLKLLAIPALLVLGTGCVTTTTQLAPVDPALVRAEEARQKVLAVQTREEQQVRLEKVAWPILVAARDLCEAKPRLGLRYGTIHGTHKDWRAAMQEVYSLGDTLSVLGVIPGSPADRAGLERGDRITAAGEFAATVGPDATRRFAEYLDKRADTAGPLTFELLRAGERIALSITPELACPDALAIAEEGALNAFADGDAIYVTTAMMRFTEDDELAVIVGHELAHNAMGHIDAKRSNAIASGLLGLLADVALATQGVNTGGAYTSQFAQLGAMTFSQDFEREADYVGMYAMALAGLPLTNAPTFWRHMAIAHPGSIQLATSHPTTAERFVRLEQTIQGIERKRRQGLPLRPEMKAEAKRDRE